MGDDTKQKKTALIVVSCILLVGLVVALVLVFQSDVIKKPSKVSASEKAITSLCSTTDYQKTCVESLQGHNSTDPKELIQVAMQSTVDRIKAAIQNSTALKQAQSDPRAKDALDTCAQLGNLAIRDLERSFAKLTQFDITNVDGILLELKTWISGSLTHQETCLDAFEKTEGDAGEKMKELLKTSMQMSSNALAMVAEIALFIEESMGVQSYQQTSRRLLSTEDDDLDQLTSLSWIDHNKRRLLSAPASKVRPNVVVAKDGSGKYKTIKEALKVIPTNSSQPFVIYIKQGIYAENVIITDLQTNVMMIGDGPTKTKITGRLNMKDGIGTYQSATVGVQGDDFMARDIGFENSAGAQKEQAVALRSSADKSIFYNCQIDGYQDTLYSQVYRQFYRDCVISGTIDFIFGDSAAVFQSCTLLFRKPLAGQQNIVAAQGRMDVRQPTAFVLQNCTFKAAPELHLNKNECMSYIGRPWKPYSRTIVMESYLDDHIHPSGWTNWVGDVGLKTLFYTEFNNRGPASSKAQRVKWAGLKELPASRIKRFTAAEFLDGNRWIQKRGLPYSPGFMVALPKENSSISYSPVTTEETKDLGSSAARKRISNLNNSTTNATPPAAAPDTPATPAGSIAAPPKLSQEGEGGLVEEAVSPTSVAPVSGELLIDLSPAPAAAPVLLLSPSTSSISIASPPPLSQPFMSTNPASSSPLSAVSPTRGAAFSPQPNPIGEAPSPTSAPPPNATGGSSPSLSPDQAGIAASPASTPSP